MTDVEDVLWDAARLFCQTPLPDTVSVDGCALTYGMSGRTGTNLLTIGEAKEMLRPIIEMLKVAPA